MRALVWRGTADIRCERVPDPEIEDDRDAIIKVTSCAICGSDLHLFDHFMPGMKSGDIMGHETMGEVVEVGPDAKDALRVGERVVIPFTIICGECEQCKRGNFSVCERSNRNKQLGDKVFGHSTAGLFGYTHLTGGIPAGKLNTSASPLPMPRISKFRKASLTRNSCSCRIFFRRDGKAPCNATSSRPIPWRFGAAARSAK